jgi:ABC-type bacteriocin/lantibiotic exporter with double-glycine peptidase domain
VTTRTVSRRRLFVPEVIQTSGMDCGVASVKALVGGFGIDVSYGRLREACQTDVDGTSINVMERLVNAIGVAAKQVILPVDHVLLRRDQVLPAIAVVRLANGFTHFVVAWRTHRGFVQVMDPARGRRWPSQHAFLRELFVHRARVPRAQWHMWASTPDFLDPLRLRMRRIGLRNGQPLIDRALEDLTGSRIAHLDAAVRMTTRLVQARAIARRDVPPLVDRLLDEEPRPAAGDEGSIPAEHWFCAPANDESMIASGSVLIRVDGVTPESRAAAASGAHAIPDAAGLLDVEQKPGNQLWRTALRQRWRLALPVAALILLTAGVLVESVMLRGLLDLGTLVALPQVRLGLFAAIPLLMLLVVCMEGLLASSVYRIGTVLEVETRTQFLRKVPRVANRFLKSRLVSDMAERCHSIARLRLFPWTIGQSLRVTLELQATGAVMIWVDPQGWPAIAAIVLLALTLPLAAQRVLAERDLRVRNLNGAMIRFYLDSLRGLLAIRTHGGERALRREHETLLVDWRSAWAHLNRGTLGLDAIQMIAGFAVLLVVVMGFLSRWDLRAGMILLLYWALTLPQLGQDLALLSRQYPTQRNVMLRLLEVLSAPEEHRDDAPAAQANATGVAVTLRDVRVVAGGHVLLDDLTLAIESGQHVGVIGRSGAGKSTLLSLLLGWHRPVRGTITIDGAAGDDAAIRALRRQTAWVDPSVQLWNTTLFANLTYGAHGTRGMERVVEDCDLQQVLAALPEGFQGELGDGGSLLSGGEGQRVRVGRAMHRPDARLVLLDEPFRGLTRPQRHAFLERARRVWSRATLLCVTHDVTETRALDYVVLIDGGRIVEHGRPEALAADANSRYRHLLDADANARDAVWDNLEWRHWHLRNGQVDARVEVHR